MPSEEDIDNLPFFHDAEARRSTPTPSRPLSRHDDRWSANGDVLVDF
jgi:hypothetical protein